MSAQTQLDGKNKAKQDVQEQKNKFVVNHNLEIQSNSVFTSNILGLTANDNDY